MPIVVLCPHGEAKPHKFASGRMNSHGTEVAAFAVCPGGWVLEQAVIIERDENGEWSLDAKAFADAEVTYSAVAEVSPDALRFALLVFLDALASAQENQQ